MWEVVEQSGRRDGASVRGSDPVQGVRKAPPGSPSASQFTLQAPHQGPGNGTGQSARDGCFDTQESPLVTAA